MICCVKNRSHNLNPRDLLPTLEEAFTLDVPAIIDCRVDYDENVKLTDHLKQIYAQADE